MAGYITDQPAYSIRRAPTGLGLNTERKNWPFSLDNADRVKRAWDTAFDALPGAASIIALLAPGAANENGWRLEIPLRDLDNFGYSNSYFNNLHAWKIEVEFNDDEREYCDVNGTMAHWDGTAGRNEKLFHFEHIKPPELHYIDVELTPDFTSLMSTINNTNKPQQLYSRPVFKYHKELMGTGTRESRRFQLSGVIQPDKLCFGLITTASLNKKNHFQPSDKYLPVNRFESINFKYYVGGSEIKYAWKQETREDKRTAYSTYANFCLDRPVDSTLDPLDWRLANHKTKTEAEYWDDTNCDGFIVADLTASRGVITFSDNAPIANANMQIDVRLTANTTEDTYIVVWRKYTQTCSYIYNPNGDTRFDITPNDAKTGGS